VALGGKKNDKRTRHNIASDRLEAALLRVEKAMTKNEETENSVDFEKMATLILENDKLSNINKVVEERLNGAINNLKKILKEA
jgi:septum formation inhibitor MinC